MQKKVPLRTESTDSSNNKTYQLPPFVMIRQYTKAKNPEDNTYPSDYTIEGRGDKWYGIIQYNPFVSISDKDKIIFFKYIMTNIDKYIKLGSVGAYVGQDVYTDDNGNGLTNHCTIEQFSCTGVRIFNNDNYSITLDNDCHWLEKDDGSLIFNTYTPCVDILYIRKDIINYAY